LYYCANYARKWIKKEPSKPVVALQMSFIFYRHELKKRINPFHNWNLALNILERLLKNLHNLSNLEIKKNLEIVKDLKNVIVQGKITIFPENKNSK
jgi:hypothetical protein